MSPYVAICHHVTKCGHCGSARFDPKTLMPEMGQLQKQLLLCSMGEAPGRREWSWSKGMRAVQTISCSTPSRYPAGVQKYQPLSSTERSKCWAKIADLSGSRGFSGLAWGWLGVGLGLFWVLAGLIELRLRHLGRFDFRKANMRFWIVCERDCPCVLQKDKSCELSWEWNQVKSPCTLAKRALSIALYNVGLDACGRAHSWLVGFVSSLLCW